MPAESIPQPGDPHELPADAALPEVGEGLMIPSTSMLHPGVMFEDAPQARLPGVGGTVIAAWPREESPVSYSHGQIPYPSRGSAPAIYVE